jgi:ribosomal protein L44E
MLLGRRDLRQETNSTEISKRPLRRKRKVTKRVLKFSCTKDNFMRELQTTLAHTFTYFVNLRFDNSLFLRCDNFQS